VQSGLTLDPNIYKLYNSDSFFLLLQISTMSSINQLTPSEESLQRLIVKLQNLVPQYVLGTLPAVATIGATPVEGLISKLFWMFRCLSCPFTGLFYFCNIGNVDRAMNAYWLDSVNFVEIKGDDVKYRPIGHHSMELVKSSITLNQKDYMKECIAEASVLDRLSSLASAYYIMIGIFAGIVRVVRPCLSGDWPYIPLSLAWTFPAIYVRVVGGRLVFRNPKKFLVDDRIIVKKLDDDELHDKKVRTFLTALFSIAIPWISVLLAFSTPPRGCGCRCKYISLLCGIWTLNSFMGYLSHVKGEKTVNGNRILHCWFVFSGFIVAGLFLLLGLLSNERTWWMSVLGPKCDVSTTCPTITQAW
jgi:hypothetical protein